MNIIEQLNKLNNNEVKLVDINDTQYFGIVCVYDDVVDIIGESVICRNIPKCEIKSITKNDERKCQYE